VVRQWRAWCDWQRLMDGKQVYQSILPMLSSFYCLRIILCVFTNSNSCTRPGNENRHYTMCSPKICLTLRLFSTTHSTLCWCLVWKSDPQISYRFRLTGHVPYEIIFAAELSLYDHSNDVNLKAHISSAIVLNLKTKNSAANCSHP
jgi:hypothetical protein